MPQELDRRDVLKRLTFGSVAVGVSRTLPAFPAQAPSSSAPAAAPPVFVRASLANGIIVHAGATAMELYHEHPHLKQEEVVQPEDISLQTRLVMRNHKEILDWMGLDWRNVVKLTSYHKRMDETKQIQQVLASYFKDWKPAMTFVPIDGLSSPQARLEIDMWVSPGTSKIARANPTPVEGMEVIVPRPEVVGRKAYALGVTVSPQMDLVFFSGITTYPFEVDPWNPGSFKVPSDPKGQGAIATEQLDALLTAAGITPPHFLLGATYTAEAGAGAGFGDRMRGWQPAGTALQVADTGVPGAKMLSQRTAVAPRKTPLNGPVPGIEPILLRDQQLRNLPAAPAIRVSSDVDLMFLSGITAFPENVDPWSPGTFTVPQDVDAQEKVVVDRIDQALKAAGISWQHVILIGRVGEVSAGTYLREKLGDWRPCRVYRAVSPGVPGAKVMYEITSVAPRKA